MNVFLICPVRNQTPEQEAAIGAFVSATEADGHKLHWPPRDTKQYGDPTGLRICQDNRGAIENCDEVWVWWDGKSEGRYFDLGMAFAFRKPIKIVFGAVPPVDGKCYERMVAHWQEAGA